MKIFLIFSMCVVVSLGVPCSEYFTCSSCIKDDMCMFISDKWGHTKCIWKVDKADYEGHKEFHSQKKCANLERTLKEQVKVPVTTAPPELNYIMKSPAPLPVTTTQKIKVPKVIVEITTVSTTTTTVPTTTPTTTTTTTVPTTTVTPSSTTFQPMIEPHQNATKETPTTPNNVTDGLEDWTTELITESSTIEWETIPTVMTTFPTEVTDSKHDDWTTELITESSTTEWGKLPEVEISVVTTHAELFSNSEITTATPMITSPLLPIMTTEKSLGPFPIPDEVLPILPIYPQLRKTFLKSCEGWKGQTLQHKIQFSACRLLQLTFHPNITAECPNYMDFLLNNPMFESPEHCVLIRWQKLNC